MGISHRLITTNECLYNISILNYRSVFGVLFLVIILSTVMDKYNMFQSAESECTTDNVVDVTPDCYRLYWHQLDFYPIFPGTASKVLYSFSLKRNVRQLLSVNESPEDIGSVHGIRALNALMLLASHKSMAMFFNPYSNRTAMTEVTIIYYIWLMIIKNYSEDYS